MPECPRCGREVGEDEEYCRYCGERLRGEETARRTRATGPSRRATEHLTLGYNLAMKKPMVFTPAVIGGVISIVISSMRRGWGLHSFQYWGGLEGTPFRPPVFSSLFLLGALISLIGSIISYILNFASIDMSRDAYLDNPLSLGGSVSYVMRRIGTFIVASIVGAIMSITIILIPAVILMFVIMVIDETGIGDALSKSFGVLSKDLGDVIIILIVAIIGSIVLGFVPYICDLLIACLNVIVGLAFIDIYFQYKK